MNKTFNDPNLKYSDQLTPLAQMAGFEGGSSDLPTPTAADAGKVLTVDEAGAYELGDVDALPAISAGDAGKVLTVNAGETGAEWAAAGGGGSPTEHILFYDDRVSHAYVTPPTDAATLPSGYAWEENSGFYYYPVHTDGTAYTADEVEAINIGDVIKTNDNELMSQTYTGNAIVAGKHHVLSNSADDGYLTACILSFVMTSANGSNVYAFGFVFFGNPSEP